jgi:DNA processing protein
VAGFQAPIGGRFLDECVRAEVSVIARDDESLPARFWSVSDPPIVLYLRGSTTRIADAIAVAIIGTRKPTEYGMKAAHRLASPITGEFAAQP